MNFHLITPLLLLAFGIFIAWPDDSQGESLPNQEIGKERDLRSTSSNRSQSIEANTAIPMSYDGFNLSSDRAEESYQVISPEFQEEIAASKIRYQEHLHAILPDREALKKQLRDPASKLSRLRNQHISLHEDAVNPFFPQTEQEK